MQNLAGLEYVLCVSVSRTIINPALHHSWESRSRIGRNFFPTTPTSFPHKPRRTTVHELNLSSGEEYLEANLSSEDAYLAHHLYCYLCGTTIDRKYANDPAGDEA